MEVVIVNHENGREFRLGHVNEGPMMLYNACRPLFDFMYGEGWSWSSKGADVNASYQEFDVMHELWVVATVKVYR